MTKRDRALTEKRTSITLKLKSELKLKLTRYNYHYSLRIRQFIRVVSEIKPWYIVMEIDGFVSIGYPRRLTLIF